ncbi:calmodulin-binding protein 60 D-like [Rhodamnia argentea]|uniref:Calmodulin-binding protein 60 D-like n=1 Tax=Rhodamnia argentea TaxID=178133 RepID=A0ABM3H4E7_9MYRT|nr:calmodulin-binding protein 60 D-like [Rhodamnia argentea]
MVAVREESRAEERVDGGGCPESGQRRAGACQISIDCALPKCSRCLDIVCSLENAVQKLEEAVEPANSHSPHLRRDNAKSMAESDARNLQLQLQTKLSLPIFTGKKLEGKGGARISVALIDANTGEVITSGLESSIKLEVVVLEGDFNKDDEDNWSQKEFENYVVKEREGKRPLLTGNLRVTLKRGVGELGDLIFTDNSSWNRSKMFKIGLKVASGYCGNTRIREAKTDAFSVKEHRGESYKKNYPPKSDDEVWRLEKIAKDGKSHKKLRNAGVHKVEDFLMQLFTDSDKLREILGESIIPKYWDCLIRHARTCKISWKLYLYYVDSMRKDGALFNTDAQLIGLIKDRVYVATHRLSAQEKEHGDTIVKKALDNLTDVMEFNGETFSGSMQKKISSSFPSQVFEGQVENNTPVQHNLAPQICAAPGVTEATLANVVSTAKGYNDGISTGYQMLPQHGNVNTLQFDGSSFPLQNPLISPSHQTQLLSPVPSPAATSGFHAAGPSSLPPYGGAEELFFGEEIGIFNMGGHSQSSFNAAENLYPFSSADMPNQSSNFAFNEDRSHSSGKAVIGWLKLKAALRWGIFVRKKAAERRAQLVELDEFYVALVSA